MELKNYSLDGLLDIEGTGGIELPYEGYVEVNLQIPGIGAYNQDALMLQVPDSKFGDKVLIQLGTQIIDTTLQVITKSYQILATGAREHISVLLSPGRLMSRQTQLKLCWIIIISRGISKPPERSLYFPSKQSRFRGWLS